MDAKTLLIQCTHAMQEKLMCDNGWNVVGWEDKFNATLKRATDWLKSEDQMELDKIFEHVTDRPYATERGCPFCASTDIEESDHCQTCVGGNPDPNHNWVTCFCRHCNKNYGLEYKSGNYWYVRDHKVIKGIPSCFESYILTCAYCGGDVKRQWRLMDGVTPKMDGCCSYTYQDSIAVPQQRCFYVCDGCGHEFEYPKEHWRNLDRD